MNNFNIPSSAAGKDALNSHGNPLNFDCCAGHSPLSVLPSMPLEREISPISDDLDVLLFGKWWKEHVLDITERDDGSQDDDWPSNAGEEE